MSDTEQLFILAGFWTAGAVVLAYFIPKWPAKVAAVALLVGIPFWELPYGYYNFHRLCSHDGGLRVFESILPQKSICADYPLDYSAKDLLRFGFESVEARNKTGEVTRIVATGATLQDSSKKLVSALCVTFVNNGHLPWRVLRHDFLVIRATDNALVARHSVFDWFGMWWQEAASPMLGRGGICREDPIQPVMTMLRSGSKGKLGEAK